MFEWRVTVTCPAPPVVSDLAATTRRDQRYVYVWTDRHSAVEAYDEALRVLQGWPEGSRPVDVIAVGMYVPAHPLLCSA